MGESVEGPPGPQGIQGPPGYDGSPGRHGDKGDTGRPGIETFVNFFVCENLLVLSNRKHSQVLRDLEDKQEKQEDVQIACTRNHIIRINFNNRVRDLQATLRDKF